MISVTKDVTRNVADITVHIMFLTSAYRQNFFIVGSTILP